MFLHLPAEAVSVNCVEFWVRLVSEDSPISPISFPVFHFVLIKNIYFIKMTNVRC